MIKKVIIAGSYDQYKRCLRDNNLRERDVPYISRASQLRGFDQVEPIYFGTFYENSELPEIEREMKSRGLMANGQYVKT